MKRWQKLVGTIGLGLVFASPMGVNAEGEEYIHVPGYTLKDRLIRETTDKSSEKWYEKMEVLSERFGNGELTSEEFNEQYEQLEQARIEEEELINQFSLIKKDTVKEMREIDYDWEDAHLHGLEYAENLESLGGEFINGIVDFRPIQNLTTLKEIWVQYADQATLREFKKLTNLEVLRLSGEGFASEEEREEAEQHAREQDKSMPLYTQAALTDISALSNATNLSSVRVYSKGVLPTITLKRGTTSYQLYDPIISSSQFDGATMNYVSQIVDNYDFEPYESSEELKWEGLTGTEEFLLFNWSIKKGNNEFSGEAQIPIRWR
ncbi:hypothetical protein [Enterococcus sp. LJL51]|uniref:hypothetical protein n=1 Tax=Enterococcus sp. LJL51 TaxID=3416656 RepID=UPI003CF29661